MILTSVNLEHIREQQREQLEPEARKFAEHLRKARESSKKWDAYFDTTSLDNPRTDAIAKTEIDVARLPTARLGFPDAPTEYVPAIRRPTTDKYPTIAAGLHTEKHDLSSVALHIALPETVNHVMSEHLVCKDQMPKQVRMCASMARQFLRQGLIYQGYLLYGPALIPLITDADALPNEMCIDY